MDFVYGFCFYYGYFKNKNLIRHIDIFNTLKNNIFRDSNWICIINVMIDEHHEIKRGELINKMRVDYNISNEIIITHNFNSSGTIGGLDDTFSYLSNHNMNNFYILYFEEDFYAINMEFLKESIIQLQDDITYVGEITYDKLSIKQTTNRGNALLKTSHSYNSDLEVWTDGGYYFTTFERLNVVKNTIGNFHCGDKSTKYNHQIDGIDYGEVGFPTRLFHNNFKFIALPRQLYFRHDE